MTTVLFVCYLTTSGTQKQHAFIGDSNKPISVDDKTPYPAGESKVDKVLNLPLIETKMFNTFDEAMTEVKLYCRKDCIHIMN